MLKDLNRFKESHKENYKVFIESINAGSKGIKGTENIFPLIHGIRLDVERNKTFYNIVEAREFLNNKTLCKNILEVSNKLLKLKSHNINDVLPQKEAAKLKSSLTLFNYITKSNIVDLLSFRNYDKKTTKLFTTNKKFTIFKKLLDKFYNGENDRATVLLIESEIYEYSVRETSLKDINKEDLKKAEDLLIRYAELGPLEILNINKAGRKKKIKEFLLGFTEEEREILKKINKPDNVFRTTKKETSDNKKMIFAIIGGILLLVVSIILSIYFLFSGTNTHTNKFSNFATREVDEDIIISKVEEKKAKEEEERLAREEAERIAKEEAERLAREEEERRQAAINASRPAVYVEPTGNGNMDMVNIAAAQVGNKGGQPFWSWYGFNHRVDWCAIFVSWVANQAGLLGETIPRFSVVSQGISYYKKQGLYRGRDYTPRPGDLIFFDWNYNGIPDHVGLVKTVDDTRVYTIEGNSKDECKELNYLRNNPQIIGYGTPNY